MTSLYDYLGFEHLQIDDSIIIKNYTASLLASLSKGDFGYAPNNNEALNAFREFLLAKAPKEKILSEVLGRIKKSHVLDQALLPAMIATFPNDEFDKDQKEKYERIKAWCLLASTGIVIETSKDVSNKNHEFINTINEAARRVRRILTTKHSWMLQELPPFDDPIGTTAKNLAFIKLSYPLNEQKKVHSIGLISALINNYIKLCLPEGISIPETQEHLSSISTPAESGLNDESFVFVEHYLAPQKNISSIEKPELEGDQAIGRKIIETIQNNGRARHTTLGGKIKQSQTIANRLSLREMRTPCEFGTLTNFERSTLLVEVWKKAAEGGSAELLLLLSLLLGRKVDSIHACLVRSNIDRRDKFEFRRERVALAHSSELPKHTLQEDIGKLIDRADKTLYLILPSELTGPIAKVQDDEQSFESIREEISSIISFINKKSGARLTIDRVAGDLNSRLRLTGIDPAEIALICGHTAAQCPSLFYYSVERARISAIHWKDNEFLFGKAEITTTYPAKITTTKRIGTQLKSKGNLVGKYFNEQKKYIESLRSMTNYNLFKFHNEITLYTYQVLSLATGHRPVTSPFELRSDIDLIRKTIWISDKETRSGLSARIIGLASTACLQITFYDQHLESLYRSLILERHPSAAKIQLACESKSPYLFRFDGSTTSHLTPKYLVKIMSDRWPLPLNWQRHFLRTELRNNGVCGDDVNALMGHAKFGEESFGAFSGYSSKNLKTIASAVEQIFLSMDITPVQGLPK